MVMTAKHQRNNDHAQPEKFNLAFTSYNNVSAQDRSKKNHPLCMGILTHKHDFSHALCINGSDNINQTTSIFNKKNEPLHLLQANDNVSAQDRNKKYHVLCMNILDHLF